MISANTSQTWVPDGLVGLLIPGSVVLADILQTASAQRLIGQGAGLYLTTDGQTAILALKRPPGAVPMAVTVRDLMPVAA